MVLLVRRNAQSGSVFFFGTARRYDSYTLMRSQAGCICAVYVSPAVSFCAVFAGTLYFF